MIVVLFEDELVNLLYPATIGKPAFAIHCGGQTLLEIVESLGHTVRVLARPHLCDVLRADGRQVGLADAQSATPLLMVNARLVPSIATLTKLQQVIKAGQPTIVRQGDQIAIALLPARTPLPSKQPGARDLQQIIIALSGTGILVPQQLDLPLFEYPHDILRHHLTTLGPNLEHRIASGRYQQTSDGVFIAPGAQIAAPVVTDTSKGPIVLEEGATVGPYCFMRGPAYLGAGARVIEHAAIKDCVALGHTTKIGGEVEGSVIEPYTNKQHHGFLGHSYLGSWINLGAGTCNSDLKNTYGNVNMEYGGHKVPTGMQFVGCMMGEYAKTAINTGIFTGKTVGACSMLYGFVTTNVPSFVNYARLFGQVTEAPVEVMVATQARMFARRNVEQRPCDVQLLHDMYELTRHERQLAGEPLSL